MQAFVVDLVKTRLLAVLYVANAPGILDFLEQKTMREKEKPAFERHIIERSGRSVHFYSNTLRNHCVLGDIRMREHFFSRKRQRK